MKTKTHTISPAEFTRFKETLRQLSTLHETMRALAQEMRELLPEDAAQVPTLAIELARVSAMQLDSSQHCQPLLGRIAALLLATSAFIEITFQDANAYAKTMAQQSTTMPQ